MAEIAGVVLGAISVMISTLDKYRGGLSVAKDHWRYDSTLQTIRLSLFVEREQLQVTLRNIGYFEPTIKPNELEGHLRRLYPGKHAQFMGILSHMGEIVEKLADKLDVDSKGKPKWSDTPPQRVKWEWRRVRRSFGQTERQALIDELAFWNNALKNCFEKHEIPSDNSDAPVRELQARFNPEQVDTVRKYARVLHEALEAGWNCVCQQPHQGNLSLDWHEKQTAPVGFNLAVSYQKLQDDPITPADERWQKILVHVTENSQAAPAQLTLQSPTMANPSFFADQFATASTKKKQARVFGALLERGSSQLAEQSPVTPPPSTTKISCLCEAIQSPCEGITALGVLPHPDSSQLWRINISAAGKSGGSMKTVSLESLLRQQSEQGLPVHRALSRKQRSGIAAAMTWAVLYLCGSPWLSRSWDRDRDNIQLFLEGTGAHQESLTGVPSISYVFDSVSASKPSSPTLEPVDRFHSDRIRNKTLFALGILLIELCLNRPFERLRLESQEDHSQLPNSTSDDLRTADLYMESIYNDAGDWYAYAVQRCLRCEFPGRDRTKSLEFASFRQEFYAGVVAPIQAYFTSIPASCSLI